MNDGQVNFIASVLYACTAFMILGQGVYSFVTCLTVIAVALAWISAYASYLSFEIGGLKGAFCGLLSFWCMIFSVAIGIWAVIVFAFKTGAP